MSALPLQHGFPDPRFETPAASQMPMPSVIGTSGPLQSPDNLFDVSTWTDVDPIDFSSYVANIAELDPLGADTWDLGHIFGEN